MPNLDSGPDGPFVMPGEFGIVLEVGDERRSQDLTVRPDDRLAVTAEERQARYDFTMELRDLHTVRTTKRGVAAYDLERLHFRIAWKRWPKSDGSRLRRTLSAPKRLPAEIEEIADEWRRLNADIRNWWTGLLGKFDGGPSTTGSLTGPSDDQRRRMARIWEARARAAEEKLNDGKGRCGSAVE